MRHTRVISHIRKARLSFAATLALASFALVATPFARLLPASWQPVSVQQRTDVRLSAPTSYNVLQYPDYVRHVGAACVETPLEPGDVRLSGLDAQGRTLPVRACVTYAMMKQGSARQRAADMGEPSGWGKNKKVRIDIPGGKAYHGWFWNRSHMLAKSLGGPDQRENMVCGTRMQNVGANNEQGGMAYSETLCRNWLAQHPQGTVQYIVTPLYVDDECIPRSVVVDMLSSDGSINEEVEVYNAAHGYDIDYHTGAFCPRT